MPEEIDDFEQVENADEIAKNRLNRNNEIKKQIKVPNINNRRSSVTANQNKLNKKSESQNNSNRKKTKLETGNNKSQKINKNRSLPFDNNKKNNDSSDNKLGKKRFQSPLKRNNVNNHIDNESGNEDNIENKNSFSKEPNDNNKLNNKDNGLKSKLNSVSHPVQGVKNVAANAVKKILKPIKIKLITSIGTFVAGLAVCFFVIYLILSPLIDIWPYIDGTVRGTANFTEKFLNFFRGFGFEDSEKAFYEEAESLNKFYENSLDMPLLLETIFYPETQNYGMDYIEHLAVDNNDPITSIISGGPSGFVNFTKNWIKDAFVNESNNTYSENGLIYNANKIYRLRRLASAMADRSGPVETISLGAFLDMLGDKFSIAIKNVIGSVIGLAVDILKDTLDLLINEIIDLVTLDFDAMAQDFNGFFQNIKESGGNVAQSIAQLISVLSFGFCSIEKISFHPITGSSSDLSLITVSYRKYRFNKDKYDEYLMDYYFENTVEYAKMLPEEETNRNLKKRQILNEIYMNKETFEELFLDLEKGTGEKYAFYCDGAIDNKIVKQLTLPVDIPVGTTPNFSNNDLFGIVNGYKQNGVILNSSNSGITTGQNVFSVYDGKIIEIHNKTNNNELTDDQNSNWIKIEHNVITTKTNSSGTTEVKNTVYTIYKYLNSISSELKVGDHVIKGQVIGTVGNVPKSSGVLVGDTLVERIWWALINAGFSKEATAGVIGNIAAETGNSNIDNITVKSTERGYSFEQIMNSSLGFGLNGWTYPAFKTAFNDYLKHTGGNWYDEEVQIGFMIETILASSTNNVNSWQNRIWSNHPDEGYYYDNFKNASTPEVAANQFCGIYERPSAGCQSNRTRAAREAYNRFKDKTMPVSTNSSDIIPGIYFEFQNSEGVAINPNNLFIKCAGAYDAIWPCSSTYISDLFGDRTYEVRNKIGNYGRCATTAHIALDIGEHGAFYAVADGTIMAISKYGVHTITLKLDTVDEKGNDIYVNYVHGDAVSNLSVGKHVEIGEKIGTANGWGSDGPNSYAVHLHFEVYTTENNNNVYHNPLTFLYGLQYDGSNDSKMNCSIPKYDGSNISQISFWNIRPELRYFASENATIGAYSSVTCDYANPHFW